MGNLAIKLSSGNLETYEALLLQLGEPEGGRPVEKLELTFGEVNQMFPTAFALMAAHVGRGRDAKKRPFVSKRFGANPHIAKLERVMNAIGFLPAIMSDKPATAVAGSGIVPLMAVGGDTEASVIANSVIDTVCETAQPTRDAKETIFVLICEMVDNIARHAQASSHSYLCGQLSAQKRKLELCIVDTGVGVQQAMSTDAALAKRIKKGESALALAIEAGTSSVGGTGFGLFLASVAVRLTHGLFRLTSGGETLILSREGAKQRTHAPWHGTVVNFLLNIDKLGSMSEVYSELPLTRLDDERFLRD